MATQDTSGVAAAVESLRTAMVSGDRAVLQKLTANELTYGHSSARLETQAEFVESLASGKSGFSKIELTNQTINVVDNVALVRHDFVGTRKADGDQMKLAILTVWLERQGSWQMVARQATRR
jgi:hypothetical protein